tara:strand:- start:1407 stop:1853 length:447 start_codon:yes stop_codon:yes gene_type:complete
MMAHNMDMNKGLYPDEPGYNEWPISKFPTEMAIEGTLTKKFQYIHPQDFHSKFLKNGLCTISPPTYTDIKIRNDIEMTNNKKYFQPKEWNLNKLLYNYNCIWHLTSNDLNFMKKYTKFLKMHIQDLYRDYKVNIKQRAFKPSGELYEV